MNRRVAAHAALGKHVPAYAGVVVLTPRWGPAGVAAGPVGGSANLRGRH